MLSVSQTTAFTHVRRTPKAGLGRRVGEMAGTWALIGVVSGISAALAAGGRISDFAAHIVASVIVLTVAGTILGLFCRRPTESLLAALVGLGVGVCAAPAGAPEQTAWSCGACASTLVRSSASRAGL